MNQIALFSDGYTGGRPTQNPRHYSPWLTVQMNRKGVIDIDTVKGCRFGMEAYPDGGCYGECYAAKIAIRCGIDFSVSVVRRTFVDLWHLATIYKTLEQFDQKWYRIGTLGDPCHDWANTVAVAWALRHQQKIPVIITKHWAALSAGQIEKLRKLHAVVNTSVSGLDTEEEIHHRIGQAMRLREAGLKSAVRVVTCEFGNSAWARERRERQDYLLSLHPVIDNPLRARISNPLVIGGEVFLSRREDSIGGGKYVSVHNESVYLGHCETCPDQCGATSDYLKSVKFNETQRSLGL